MPQQVFREAIKKNEMNYLRIFLLILLFVWALSSCKGKTLLNNDGSANGSETVQLSEASFIEL